MICKIVLFLLAGTSAWADPSQDLKDDIQRLIKKSGISADRLGIHIQDDHRKVVFSLNEDKQFTPASILKLMTSAAALHTFMPQHQFTTEIYTDGSVKGSTLDGNIYIKGYGDPNFVSEKMYLLVNEFFRTGIKRITGNIIADDSYFDGERIDPERGENDEDRAYSSPVGALSFNWNSITIYVRPGSAVGKKAEVFLDTSSDFVVLKNQVTTKKKASGISIDRTSNGKQDVFTVSGAIGVGDDEKVIYKSISNPPLFAGENLKLFLKYRDIEVQGKVVSGVVPKSAKLAASIVGDQLSQIVFSMNKFSNNYVAEMLTKAMGADGGKSQGTLAKGLVQIRKFLENEVGLKSGQFVLSNPSGLSRNNQFTPKQFVDLLSYVLGQGRIAPEFLLSLPVAGVDGTLKERMKGTDAETWVRAKTGLLNGVAALAGFALKPTGGMAVFAFICNESGSEQRAKALYDSIAVLLVKAP